MERRILPVACFLYLTVANLIWIARDNRPPFWDMAYHQTAALRIVDAFSERGVSAIAQIPELTGSYPPVYHSIVAVFYAVFGPSARVGQLANIPAAFILIFATWAIARSLLPSAGAGVAAALITFFPIMVWLSRAAMIDYWLASMVAFAMWLLICKGGFSDRRMSLLFGLACGVGLLTKASFAAFVGLPALWYARSNWKNALMAAGIALGVAACWYGPQWSTFTEFYAFNSASGVAEGDPARWSIDSLLFYVRVMEGYQLFLPLFVLFCLGAVQLARKFDAAWAPVALWMLGGWMALLLLQNKDPRYSMPLLPAVALITAKLFANRTAWLAALLPLLLVQHFMISFGIPWLPQEVVLARGGEGRWVWNWNLYTQSYGNLWGKPINANWHVDDVIDRISLRTPRDNSAGPVRLGLVPDIPSFDAQSFEFAILRRRATVAVSRIGTYDSNVIKDSDYILVDATDKDFVGKLNEAPDRFERVDSFELPGGSRMGLYQTIR